MEYNFGEDHGGKWCSERCRWWSSVLIRSKYTDVLKLRSKAHWEAFYQDYYQRWGETVPAPDYAYIGRHEIPT